MSKNFKNSGIKYPFRTTPFSPIASSQQLGWHHEAIIGRNFNCNYLNKILFPSSSRNKGIFAATSIQAKYPCWNAASLAIQLCQSFFICCIEHIFIKFETTIQCKVIKLKKIFLNLTIIIGGVGLSLSIVRSIDHARRKSRLLDNGANNKPNQT